MKNVSIILISICIGILSVTAYAAMHTNSRFVPMQVKQKSDKTFSIVPPPSNTLQGTITAMNGDIQFVSRVATEPAKLLQPVPVQQAEEFFTGDNGSLSIAFSNALSIKMDPKTHVNFVQTLPANIVINQDKGSALYSKLGSVLVSVRTQRLLINIDGTVLVSFSNDQSTSTIQVQKGSATVAYNDIDYNSVVQQIEENQTFKFDYPTETGLIE